MDDTNKTQGAGQETGPAEEKPGQETGPAKKKPRPRPVAKTPPRGMTSSVNRKAVFGPDGPAAEPGPRERLCRRLNLKNPTDEQLFADAEAYIGRLLSAVEGG